MGRPSSMLPDPRTIARTQQAIGLWNEVAAAYDAIERRLGSGAWDGFAELAGHLGELERELEPLLAEIASTRADGTTYPAEISKLWHEHDAMVEALARRRAQLERAAVRARDMIAARLAQARIARSRAAEYTPLNPLTPRFMSRRV